MMYTPDPNARFNHQLSRATNFAMSFARFGRALEKYILAPEVFHLNPKKSDTKLFRNVCKTSPPTLSWFGAVAFEAFPLDMSQYKSTFNGTRIPKKGKDVLHQDGAQKHFMVLYRVKIYAFDIFDDNGDLRVRYYACETLHMMSYLFVTSSLQSLCNIVKICKVAVLSRFDQLFDVLWKLSADNDQNVRSGAELLNRLLMDTVVSNEDVDIANVISLIRDRIYVQTSSNRKFIEQWLNVMLSTPAFIILPYVVEVSDGLFRMLADS